VVDGKTQSVTVTIAKPVTAVRIPLTKIYLKQGKPLMPPVCAYRVDPVTKKADTAAKLTWESSNAKVATVNPTTGRITPKKPGKAKITVKVGKYKYARTITVK
jgi:hypothetical protein